MSKSIGQKVSLEGKSGENHGCGEKDSHVLPYTTSQTVGYISDIVRELQLMAQRADLPFLAYLLELSYEEAESQKRKTL